VYLSLIHARAHSLSLLNLTLFCLCVPLACLPPFPPVLRLPPFSPQAERLRAVQVSAAESEAAADALTPEERRQRRLHYLMAQSEVGRRGNVGGVGWWDSYV
jgi:hypothetical protein